MDGSGRKQARFRKQSKAKSTIETFVHGAIEVMIFGKMETSDLCR